MIFDNTFFKKKMMFLTVSKKTRYRQCKKIPSKFYHQVWKKLKNTYFGVRTGGKLVVASSKH